MRFGERSSSYIFAAITLILAALAGVLIPLASGNTSRTADTSWTPPTVTPTSLPVRTATAVMTRPAPTPTVQEQPTGRALTATPATPMPTAVLATSTPASTPRITATPPVTDTLAASTPVGITGPMARITGDTVNLRAGPGISFGVFALAAAGDTFAVTGQTPDGTQADGSGIPKWWRVCCVRGEAAWVANDFVEIIGGADTVPVVQ